MLFYENFFFQKVLLNHLNSMAPSSFFYIHLDYLKHFFSYSIYATSCFKRIHDQPQVIIISKQIK